MEGLLLVSQRLTPEQSSWGGRLNSGRLQVRLGYPSASLPRSALSRAPWYQGIQNRVHPSSSLVPNGNLGPSSMPSSSDSVLTPSRTCPSVCPFCSSPLAHLHLRPSILSYSISCRAYAEALSQQLVEESLPMAQAPHQRSGHSADIYHLLCVRHPPPCHLSLPKAGQEGVVCLTWNEFSWVSRSTTSQSCSWQGCPKLLGLS